MPVLATMLAGIGAKLAAVKGATAAATAAKGATAATAAKGATVASAAKSAALPAAQATPQAATSVGSRIRGYMNAIPDASGDGPTRGDILRDGLKDARMSAADTLKDRERPAPPDAPQDQIGMSELLQAYGIR